MSIQPIRLYIDPILHKPVDNIVDFTGLDNIASDMIETMLSYRGIGLAANQIGLNKNLAVLYLENKTKIILVSNISNVRYNNTVEELAEGCLSAPGVIIRMKRFTSVEFEYSKLNGEKDKMKLEGFDARIFQHEFDHIFGKMITDGLMKL